MKLTYVVFETCNWCDLENKQQLKKMNMFIFFSPKHLASLMIDYNVNRFHVISIHMCINNFYEWCWDINVLNLLEQHFFYEESTSYLWCLLEKKSIWKLEILLTFSALLRGLQISRGIYDSPLIRYNFK